MAAQLVIPEAPALVVRRCLEHHLELVSLSCPIGGEVFMRQTGRCDWRHITSQRRADRYPLCWEVYSNYQERPLAVVLGGGVIWLDEADEAALRLIGRDRYGQALGRKPERRRGIWSIRPGPILIP